MRSRATIFFLCLVIVTAEASCRPVHTITVTTTTTTTHTASGITTTITFTPSVSTSFNTIGPTTSITTPFTTLPATTTTATPIITPTTPVATTSTPAPTSTAAGLFAAPWDDMRIYRQNLIDSEESALANLKGASVYRINIQIAPDYLSLSGHEDVHYTNRETVGLTDIYFQLFPSMTGGKTTVTAVSINGKPNDFTYEFNGGSLRVPLANVLPVGGSIIIGVDFKVDIPASVLDNYGLFGYTRAVLALNGFYPAIPAYDDKGWHAGPYPPQSDNTYQDAAFYLVRVSAPVKLVTAASGVTVDSATGNGTKSVTFAAGPARDFYLAGSEQYSSRSTTSGGTTVNCYYLPGGSAGAGTALDVAKAALSSFGSRIAVYPYTELDIVPLDLQAGASGIEYPGIIGVDMDAYSRGATLEPSVAHEIGHQWFYNAVGDDQIDEPWLDESMTQYITGLYYLDAHGNQGWQSQLQDWNNRWSRVQFADIPVGLPSGNYPGAEYSAIIYGRGPLFINALAQQLGQDKFSRFLKQYYQDNKWQVATTQIYKNEAEAICTCDLTPIFKEWVLP